MAHSAFGGGPYDVDVMMEEPLRLAVAGDEDERVDVAERRPQRDRIAVVGERHGRAGWEPVRLPTADRDDVVDSVGGEQLDDLAAESPGRPGHRDPHASNAFRMRRSPGSIRSVGRPPYPITSPAWAGRSPQ